MNEDQVSFTVRIYKSVSKHKLTNCFFFRLRKMETSWQVWLARETTAWSSDRKAHQRSNSAGPSSTGNPRKFPFWLLRTPTEPKRKPLETLLRISPTTSQTSRWNLTWFLWTSTHSKTWKPSIIKVRKTIQFPQLTCSLLAVTIDNASSQTWLSMMKMFLVCAICAGQVYFTTAFFNQGNGRKGGARSNDINPFA